MTDVAAFVEAAAARQTAEREARERQTVLDIAKAISAALRDHDVEAELSGGARLVITKRRVHFAPAEAKVEA